MARAFGIIATSGNRYYVDGLQDYLNRHNIKDIHDIIGII